jgi:hydroxypyruvate isomerase
VKLSICIDAIFRGLTAPEAMRKAHEAGYDTYEFWGWWDKDLEAMRSIQHTLNMTPAAMCTRFFSLVNPDGHLDFLKGLEESILAAKRLGCKNLIAQCGQDTGLSREFQRGAMIVCLKQAAPILESSGMTLLLEPLNLIDHPGYYLTSSQEAVEVLEAVSSPNIKMLFDLYHQQITEGDLIRRVLRALPYIGHFHAAGNPGRGELGTGELNYRNIFAAIAGTYFDGCVGLEYFPQRPAEEGLSEARAMFQSNDER